MRVFAVRDGYSVVYYFNFRPNVLNKSAKNVTHEANSIALQADYVTVVEERAG